MGKEKIKILLAEDEPKIRNNLVEILNMEGYQVTDVENGKEAQKAIDIQDFDIYITDLMMPIVDGEQFIRKLKIKIPDAVVLVTTAVVAPERIIEIMNLGVYDYIIKPVMPPKLFEVLERAIELKLNQDLLKKQYLSKTIEKRDEILWKSFQDRVENKEKTQISKSLIHNLQATISQGSGLGLAITITNLIQETIEPQKNEASYTMDKEIIDMLVDNNVLCKMQILSLTNALSILSRNQVKLELLSSGELFLIIQKLKNAFEQIGLERKQLTIHIYHPSEAYNLDINKEFVHIALEELLINAFKYSLENSNISFSSIIRDGFFIVIVKNDVYEETGKISEEQSNIITEPFLRLLPPVETFNDIEKYGIGLGLTVVNHIAKLHYGFFALKSFTNYIKDSRTQSIIAELAFPIIGKR